MYTSYKTTIMSLFIFFFFSRSLLWLAAVHVSKMLLFRTECCVCRLFSIFNMQTWIRNERKSHTSWITTATVMNETNKNIEPSPFGVYVCAFFFGGRWKKKTFWKSCQCKIWQNVHANWQIEIDYKRLSYKQCKAKYSNSNTGSRNCISAKENNFCPFGFQCRDLFVKLLSVRDNRMLGSEKFPGLWIAEASRAAAAVAVISSKCDKGKRIYRWQ